MPDLFHVIPVGYTMLDGVPEGQHIALGLGLAALSEVSERYCPTGTDTYPT